MLAKQQKINDLRAEEAVKPRPLRAPATKKARRKTPIFIGSREIPPEFWLGDSIAPKTDSWAARKAEMRLRGWYDEKSLRAISRNNIRSTIVEMDHAYWDQGCKCAICGFEPASYTVDALHDALHADHDHSTGNFRGWLCFDCNMTRVPAASRGAAYLVPPELRRKVHQYLAKPQEPRKIKSSAELRLEKR